MTTPLKKSLWLAAFCLLLAWPAAAQTKIAIIDLRKVFDEYYKTKAADASLKDRAADLEKELKTLTEQYRKATDDYKKALDDANNQAISADEREKRKKSAEGKLLEIKELEQTIRQYERTAHTTLEEQKRSFREKILGEIRAVIDAKAKAGMYSLVLDTAAESFNQTPVVVYSNGENDLTAAVLAQLNASAPPGALKPADPKPAK